MYNCAPVFIDQDVRDKYYKGAHVVGQHWGRATDMSLYLTAATSAAGSEAAAMQTVHGTVARWHGSAAVQWRVTELVCDTDSLCVLLACVWHVLQASASSSCGRCSTTCCRCHPAVQGASTVSCGRHMSRLIR
jgi:hypothetical protein